MDTHDIVYPSINILHKAKQNGIVILTFPSHCIHKLKPLYRSVYGPLKHYYNIACNESQMKNPGKPMTIYDVAENLGEAFPRAFICENIIVGYRVSGIYLMDRNIFRDDEFLSAFVTDRPEPMPE